jgi:A/G-specific adenine glycosylase
VSRAGVVSRKRRVTSKVESRRTPVSHESRIADQSTQSPGAPAPDHGSLITDCGNDSRTFAERVIAWQKQHGRHDLPWQNTRDPYRIWLSEIMLQQTQVSAVIPYYLRFLARFPDLASLAAASEDEVLQLWAGLGYYARARNLYAAARSIVRDLEGEFPRDLAAVSALPGVGPSTAAAICAFAYGARHAILDGNVKRVLARYFGVAGYPGDKRVETQLWAHSNGVLPNRDIEAYTQGLMDLGAGLCLRKTPDCGRCPVAERCRARREKRTAELPAPRPARSVPQRSTTMMILQRQGEVLLEKRPAPGVWGGLWCFPEVDAARIAEECIGRYGLEATAVAHLATIEHGFTHFSLRIAPVVVVVRPRPGAEEPGRVWLTPEDALGAAIPVPVKRILQALAQRPTPPTAEIAGETAAQG